MFLLYCFLFLDKIYHNQSQEGFIICHQKQPLEVFRKKKVFLKILEISQKNTCVGVFC